MKMSNYVYGTCIYEKLGVGFVLGLFFKVIKNKSNIMMIRRKCVTYTVNVTHIQ